MGCSPRNFLQIGYPHSVTLFHRHTTPFGDHIYIYGMVWCGIVPLRWRYRPPLLTTALPAMLLASPLCGKLAEERRAGTLLWPDPPEAPLIGLTLVLLPPLPPPPPLPIARLTISSTWASRRLSSMMSYTSSALLLCSPRPFHSRISSPGRWMIVGWMCVRIGLDDHR